MYLFGAIYVCLAAHCNEPNIPPTHKSHTHNIGVCTTDIVVVQILR